MLRRFQPQLNQTADSLGLSADLLRKSKGAHFLPLFSGELKGLANRVCCFHAVHINYRNDIDNWKGWQYQSCRSYEQPDGGLRAPRPA